MAGPNPHCTSSASLSSIVKTMYPEIFTSTHSVPPMYFSQVAYRRQKIPGTELPALVLQSPSHAAPVNDLTPVILRRSPPRLLWNLLRQPFRRRPERPKRVQQTDVIDDTAQAQVLRNLQVFGESHNETMFIVSQLNFNEYLNDPAYAAAAAQVPAVPVDLTTGKQTEGDFDVLVIHRQYGILIGELKTVGRDSKFRTDAIVSSTIKKALKQLDKSNSVVSHLVSDVASPGMNVRTTLFLPYVRKKQLKKILAADHQLRQDACAILGATDARQAARMCCCRDHMSDPKKWWEVTPEVIKQLEVWWNRRMDSVNTELTDDIYLEVVTRFVGPATSVSVHCSTGPRVKVKTVDQAVCELARRLTTLVLTPEQIDLMHRLSRLPLVYLTGPPGTGKTVLLTLVGLSWLRQGKDVHVVSGHDTCRAASRMIKKQLEATLAAYPASPVGCGRVVLHDYDLDRDAEKHRAVRELAACGPDVCALFDELTARGHSGCFDDLLGDLRAQVTNLKVWAAGVHKETPAGLQQFKLTIPLRSAPAILRVVEKSIVSTWPDVHRYENPGFPAAGDGLRVKELVHDGSGRLGHREGLPQHCFRCGRNVADVLRGLGVGVPGSEVKEKDVLILSEYMRYLRTRYSVGNVWMTGDCHLVRALQQEGLAVRVMADPMTHRDSWIREVGEVAEDAWNSIVVTDNNSVHGLERKVVVVLDDSPFNTLYSASRATVQLVIVSTRR